MTKVFFPFYFLLGCFIMAVFQQHSFAQGTDTGNEIFTIVEEQPQFPGGDMALSQYLRNNLKYPETARVAKVEGAVFVSFVVEIDGTVSNIKIVKGLHPDCDAEVIRVISEMPKWSPGKQKGKPVRVQFTLPVRFML